MSLGIHTKGLGIQPEAFGILPENLGFDPESFGILPQALGEHPSSNHFILKKRGNAFFIGHIVVLGFIQHLFVGG